MSDYKGISFPFRFNSSGGVSTSSTNTESFDHIRESVTQILLTKVGERVFNPEFGSNIISTIFDSQDSTTKALLAEYIREALEPLKETAEIVDVIVREEVNSEGEEALVADVVIFVKKFLKSDKVTVNLTEGGMFNG